MKQLNYRARKPFMIIDDMNDKRKSGKILECGTKAIKPLLYTVECYIADL